MVENVDRGFQLEFNADKSIAYFTVKGAGIGIGVWCCSMLSAIFIGGLFAAAGGLPVFIATISLIFTVVFIADRKMKTIYKFELTSRVFKLSNGKEYARRDISELLMQNASGHSIQSTSVAERPILVSGAGVTGTAFVGATIASNAARNIGAATGTAIVKSLNKRSFVVAIRHGRKIIPLAKNMFEGDAVSLFNATSELASTEGAVR